MPQSSPLKNIYLNLSEILWKILLITKRQMSLFGLIFWFNLWQSSFWLPLNCTVSGPATYWYRTDIAISATFVRFFLWFLLRQCRPAGEWCHHQHQWRANHLGKWRECRHQTGWHTADCGEAGQWGCHPHHCPRGNRALTCWPRCSMRPKLAPPVFHDIMNTLRNAAVASFVCVFKDFCCCLRLLALYSSLHLLTSGGVRHPYSGTWSLDMSSYFR